MLNKKQNTGIAQITGNSQLIRGIDLFCGAGGLTRGLESANISIGLGIDIDPACEYPYTANNNATFLLKSVEQINSSHYLDIFENAAFKLLAGCAPCQPFSTYSRAWANSSDERWHLLEHFSRLVKESRPHLVTMENVPLLRREQVFHEFLSVLRKERFHIDHRIVNCADYGVPQQRQRLVLLASTLGPIDFIKPTTPGGRRLTVRDTIGDLPPLQAGEFCKDDHLHLACALSPINLRRIRASKPGGTWRDWENGLVAACHRKKSGKSYASVYGRMTWDAPAPTLTTQFYGFGNGRFGHPDQDRAISLREGAMLQSFPENYKLVPNGNTIYRKTIGRMIGNAVPVKLAEAIGTSIVLHVKQRA